jgi:hypothetical protein
MPTSTLSPTGELNLVPISVLAERLIGKRPSPATVWRWMRKGSRGSRLTATMVMGRWCCTDEQFKQFLAGTSASQPTAEPVAADDRALKAAGLL